MNDTLAFTKLEGLGNDFVLLDGRQQVIDPAARDIRALAARHTGIGCDQILVLRAPGNNRSTVAFDVYNSDGSPARQCGNGVRCIAWWLHRRGELPEPAVLESPGGPVAVSVQSPELVRAELPGPDFPDGLGGQIYDLGPAGRVKGIRVNLGNPHLVTVIDHDPDREIAETLGRAINELDAFPDGVNLGCARILDGHTLVLRVFERGSGLTPACGSGACAAAAALIAGGGMTSPATVIQPGGSLVIEWAGRRAPVAMTGPAREVFHGELEWPTNHD